MSIRRWVGLAVPNGSFASVSCATPSACVAAGTYTDGKGLQVPAAERGDGSRWSIITPQPGFDPATGQDHPPASQLSAVSCTSATNCIAVGSLTAPADGGTVSLIEQWNGSGWTVLSSPTVNSWEATFLDGVSCTSASACMAVGSYYVYNGTQGPLAEAWNGTKWTIETVAAPAGGGGNLRGVSCTSASDCIGVGSYVPTGASQSQTFAESWNGTSWSLQATATSPPNSELNGVSCPAAGDCEAVGAANGAPLAERWNGSSWTTQAVSPAAGTLSSCSCPAVGSCEAVGTTNGAALAEQWNGSSWTQQSVSASVGGLTSVSCGGASSCLAVGAPLSAAAWNGSSWTSIPMPPVPAPLDTVLSSVSCWAADGCMAIGSSVPAGVGLAETWNGSAWTAEELPASMGDLSSVSCTSPTSCIAVGTAPNAGGTTAAALLNGTSWSSLTPQNVSGTNDDALNGVSCTSVRKCYAVGFAQEQGQTVTSEPLAERWNGTRWSLEPTQDAKFGELNGVWCRSQACTAVGSYHGSNGENRTLAEGRTSSGWVIQSTPNPAGAVSSTLSGVSCQTPAACLAVGSWSGASSSTSALGEVWNGAAWSLDSPPAPTPNATDVELNGVSCVAVGCEAVGDYTDGAGVVVPLAELYSP